MILARLTESGTPKIKQEQIKNLIISLFNNRRISLVIWILLIPSSISVNSFFKADFQTSSKHKLKE